MNKITAMDLSEEQAAFPAVAATAMEAPAAETLQFFTAFFQEPVAPATSPAGKQD
jgi:hypothetical protein